MEHPIKQLTYGEKPIRMTTDESGETWWVAKDVCDVLEIQNIAQAVGRLDEDEKGICSTDTPGGSQEVNTVNEFGLYALILGSRKPEAKAFKRWMTHEVLPSIRRTGRYEAPGPARAIPPRSPERAEVSEHLVRVWQTLKAAQEWLTNREVARRSGVVPRTARAHTKYLLGLGMLDTLETFPRHLFRVSEQAEHRNAAIYRRLNLIEEALAGQTLPAIIR